MSKTMYKVCDEIFANSKCENCGRLLPKDDDEVNAEYTACTIDEAMQMAQHIVYVLYNGKFPD